MSNNERAGPVRTAEKKPDRRVSRTRGRLAGALVALIHEKPFDSITLREVLDRANVGRSTFYLHYRDIDDLFVSDVEEFLECVSNSLSTRKETSDRVAPMQELFAHIRDARQFYDALVASGRIDAFYELAEGQFARGIERRLKENPRSRSMAPELRRPLSHAYAGAMLALLRWWVNTGMKVSPEEMDNNFHRMVWGEAAR